MFTGLVEDLGIVDAIEQTADGVRLHVRSRLTAAPGDSVAVNGVCLTAVDQVGSSENSRLRNLGLVFDVMQESLRRSTLGDLTAGSRVNLELALRADARLGGHIVQGHVDGVGEVTGVREEGFARVVTVAAPAEVLRYVVEKGSIAVNGVSLTVSAIGEESFEVSLIPETLERTTLGASEPGTQVNLEVDVLAKYVEKLVRNG